VRGWLRRFTARAELIRGLATWLALRIDPHLLVIEMRGSPARDALHALGVAVGAVARRFGEPRSPWNLLAALSAARCSHPAPSRRTCSATELSSAAPPRFGNNRATPALHGGTSARSFAFRPPPHL
jgi:hypothetical protein